MCVCHHTCRSGTGHHIAGERDVAGSAAFQRDGVDPEVTEHVHDRGEAQVLDATLAPLRQRQAQVLGRDGWKRPSVRGTENSSQDTKRVTNIKCSFSITAKMGLHSGAHVCVWGGGGILS